MEFSPEALREALEAGGVSFKQNAASFILTCPICQKSQKLYIRKRDGYFKCWLCAETEGFKGRAQYALAKLFGGSPRDYEPQLYGGVVPLEHLEDDDLNNIWRDDEFEEPEPELTGWEWPPGAVPILDAKGARGLSYLEGRGIPAAVAERYGIYYSPHENRVLFPFYVGGELCGWQGRYCGPVERTDPATGRVYKIPKALTTIQEEVVGRYVMFGDRLEGCDHCVLTEGPISAIKADLCGGNVASLGKGVSPKQLKWIASKVKRVYLGLDPDAANDVMRITRELSDYDVATYLLPPAPGREDLGDCTFEEVLEQFRGARRLRPGQIVDHFGGRFVF